MKLISLLTPLFLILAQAPAIATNAEGEEMPVGEAAATQEIVELISRGVRENHAKDGRAFRDAHRKQHGCVKAEFEVIPSFQKELRQGLFAQAKNYNAIIRYSNGSGEVKDDREGDGRGMAIKILGVEGRKLLEDELEETTQDFLMINHPVFFVRNVEEYLSFQKATSSGSLLKWLFHPKRVFHELLIANAIRNKEMKNPLEARYFGMTASRYGNEQAKFSVRPCLKSNFQNSFDGVDRLRENLAEHLATRDACFEFQVQLRTSEEMSVEDPTIEWSESESPFRTVARIFIPKQQPDLGENCEALSFTPWHSIEEHRPLGGISRVRKEVYKAISTLRHELNGQVRAEPRI